MTDVQIAARFSLAAWLVIGVTALYAVDHATVNAPPGTSAGHNLLLGLPLIVLAALWALAVVTAPPPLKVWLAFVAGALMVAVGGMHVAHIQKNGLGGGDLTGLLVGLCGVLLLVLAAVTAARPKAPRRPVAKWAARVGVVVAVPVTLLLVVTPLYLGIYPAYKPASDVSLSGLPPGHREVTLRTADGVKLAASYIPSRNGAAVLLLHGSGGDRSGTIASRARMLARNGFGVLVYDARGSGDSSGHQENIGWTWPRDVKAGLDWLISQPDVHRGRVGALGLSTGAEVLLQAAAQDPRIGAVVAEGAQARSLTERNLLPMGGVKLYTMEQYGIGLPLYRALTHAPTAPSLGTLVPRIAPRPVLLIAAGKNYERDMNRAYKRRSGASVRLWEMPNAAHTGGLTAAPRLYERRVVNFFDDALRQ